MLNAGTAKSLLFATVSRSTPFINMGTALLVCWKSNLDCAGRHPTDEIPLEEQEQRQDGNTAQNAHRHHLVPLIGMLAHEELDADGNRPHVLGARQRECEEELVPAD